MVNTLPGVAADGRIVHLSTDDETYIRRDGVWRAVGLTVQVAEASQTIAAGQLVNLYDDAGTLKARLADASVLNQPAHGFATNTVGATAPVAVAFENNGHVTGLSAGPQFLSDTPGEVQATPPVGAPMLVQRVGVAMSPTLLRFEPAQPIVRSA